MVDKKDRLKGSGCDYFVTKSKPGRASRTSAEGVLRDRAEINNSIYHLLVVKRLTGNNGHVILYIVVCAITNDSKCR